MCIRDRSQAKQAEAIAAPGTAHAGNLFEVLGYSSALIGIVVAAISAAIAIKWLVGFLNTHGLTPFGWYRIVLGVSLIGLILGGVVSF